MTEPGRRFETEIEIAAPLEAVWLALTDPTELTRWFPLQAEVVPGVGGTMAWSWDGAFTWASEIARWEPPTRLRLVQRSQRPFDVAGRPLPEGTVGGATLLIDFRLETDGGSTRLRLVHSGFGPGAEWDDEYDGISGGWRSELRSLRRYLTRHRGRDRGLRMLTGETGMSPAETWRRLVGAGAVRISPWPAADGDRVDVRIGDGVRLAGHVDLWIPEVDLTVVLDDLDGGVIRLGTHRSGGRTGVTCSVADYREDGDGRDRVFAAVSRAVTEAMAWER